MATITRGQHRGHEAVLHQFANDWLMVDVDCVGTINGIIVSPTSIRLTAEEVARVRADPNKGSLLDDYELSDEGRFTKVKRRSGRR